jgi:hypothetical protein
MSQKDASILRYKITFSGIDSDRHGRNDLAMTGSGRRLQPGFDEDLGFFIDGILSMGAWCTRPYTMHAMLKVAVWRAMCTDQGWCAKRTLHARIGGAGSTRPQGPRGKPTIAAGLHKIRTGRRGGRVRKDNALRHQTRASDAQRIIA